jgi:hypothetical protein
MAPYPPNNLIKKPVSDYLINGPIPADSLANQEIAEICIDEGVADSELDIHFMLERICVHGTPGWWQGSITDFEQKFHDNYQREIEDLNSDSQHIIQMILDASWAEVEEGRLEPLSEVATTDEAEIFLAQGRKRLEQLFALETIFTLWIKTVRE